MGGSWSEDSIVDRIAILYIFMPQIRAEMVSFVHEWNAHTIRRQKNRPHVHSGKPTELYRRPAKGKAIECKVRVPKDRFEKLKEVRDADGLDLQAYLPDEMMYLCDDFINAAEAPEQDRNPETPFLGDYMYLRECLKKHEEEGKEPALSLLKRPTGNWDEFVERMEGLGVDLSEAFGQGEPVNIERDAERDEEEDSDVEWSRLDT